MERIYACIDLKSFYASCECVERGLEPLNTNLVVADESRTEKTICLAVSPSLKKYGVGGRCRLFELLEAVKKINHERKKNNNYKPFTSKSYLDSELINNNLELDFIIAKPRMSLYMDYSNRIYNIYLKHLSKDDIYVYSIDEIFCDITPYLKHLNLSPEEFITKILKDVYKETKITATAGIGTNLFLAKVAMDVVAKKAKANSFGVRIASLNNKSFREIMWDHKPLTDIWRIGRGINERLEKLKIYTLGDIARTSIENEDILFKEFGINAELLIDHAWGIEPCTIKDIKEYTPSVHSITQGQVLHEARSYSDTEIIIREMAYELALSLVEKKYLTNQITLTIIYDAHSLDNLFIRKQYTGKIVKDYLDRIVPKPSSALINIDNYTQSSKIITKKLLELYDRITNKILMIKKINISANNLINLDNDNKPKYYKISLFEEDNIDIKDDNEIKLQKTIIDIKKKYGKNSILKLMNLEKGGTTIERNSQIGGHHE